MSFKRHACSYLQPQQPNSPTNHIWISDELLNNLYRSFSLSKIARRYGSSVPGPLEAQRRAAKRRMMGLAKAGGGAIDPALLVGLDSGRDLYGWKWQAPSSPPQKPPLITKKGDIDIPTSVRLSADC